MNALQAADVAEVGPVDVDWESAARQLLRAVRGQRSQVAFSRRLGYRSNPVADWEAGRRFPTAAELLRAAARAGVDVQLAFEGFDPDTAAIIERGRDQDIARWLRAYRGDVTVQDLADRCGRTRYAVGRWLSGSTRPRVPDFLRAVEALTGRCVDLVGVLVSGQELPALAAKHTELGALREVAAAQPWALVVRAMLSSRAYRRLTRHRRGWIASRLGLEDATEQSCLDWLAAAGLIAWSDDRWVAVHRAGVDPLTDVHARRAMHHHLRELAFAGGERPAGNELYSGVMVPMDVESWHAARALLQRALEEVVALSRRSVSNDVIGYVDVSALDLLVTEAAATGS